MSQPTNGAPIEVAIAGAAGRMGMAVAHSVLSSSDLKLVSVIDVERVGTPYRSIIGVGPAELIVSKDLESEFSTKKPNVLVDFTNPSVAANHARVSIQAGIAPVIGTSGLSTSNQSELEALALQLDVPVMIVPNFAIGAVLMMHFSELAAKWMPNVEIIEMHHDQKLDAPSGTGISTAQRIAAARLETPTELTKDIKYEGARGAKVDGVTIHSVRLKGLVAHQAVMFGGQGETLTIQHDSLDRSSFMQGVLLCIRNIWKLQGLTIGLESLLFD